MEFPGFSESFSAYFFKHFPQWRRVLSPYQQHHIQKFAQIITHEQDIQKIWACLEANPFLLTCLMHHIHSLAMSARKGWPPERMITGWILSLFICLGLVIGFNQHLSSEVISIVSVILGILGMGLKQSCEVYAAQQKMQKIIHEIS